MRKFVQAIETSFHKVFSLLGGFRRWYICNFTKQNAFNVQYQWRWDGTKKIFTLIGRCPSCGKKITTAFSKDYYSCSKCGQKLVWHIPLDNKEDLEKFQTFLTEE